MFRHTSQFSQIQEYFNRTQKTLIFNFHGLGQCQRAFEKNEKQYWVSINCFEFFVEKLMKLKDSVDIEFEITFDDSNESDILIALPVLKKFEFSATFFILTGKIGRPGYLNESQILEISKNKMKIGSHGINHVPWTSLDKSKLHSELKESKNILEEIINQEIDMLSCPMGQYNRYVVKNAIKCGYKKVFTSDKGFTKPNSFLQSRNTITKSDNITIINKLLEDNFFLKQLIIKLKSTIKRLR